jgi:hypothetical protein
VKRFGLPLKAQPMNVAAPVREWQAPCEGTTEIHDKQKLAAEAVLATGCQSRN